MDSLDLCSDAQIALAVAFGADHAHGRLVDKFRISAKLESKADGLRGTARMAVDQNCFWVGQGELFQILLSGAKSTAGNHQYNRNVSMRDVKIECHGSK